MHECGAADLRSRLGWGRPSGPVGRHLVSAPGSPPWGSPIVTPGAYCWRRARPSEPVPAPLLPAPAPAEHPPNPVPAGTDYPPPYIVEAPTLDTADLTHRPLTVASCEASRTRSGTTGSSTGWRRRRRADVHGVPGPPPFFGCSRLDGKPIAPAEAHRLLEQVGDEHAARPYIGDGPSTVTPRRSM